MVDPSTCKPGELYVVKAQYVDTGVVREVYAMRSDPDDPAAVPWLAVETGDWLTDSEVTVIRRADQPPNDREILRRAVALYATYTPDADYTHLVHDGLYAVVAVVNDLEAERKAEQEKAAADAKREALIEKAARVLLDSALRSVHLGDHARALADAGLLADTDD